MTHTIKQPHYFEYPHCRVAVAETIENPQWSMIVTPSSETSKFTLIPSGSYAFLMVKTEPSINTTVSLIPKTGSDPIVFKYYGKPKNAVWIDNYDYYAISTLMPLNHFVILNRYQHEYSTGIYFYNPISEDTVYVVDTSAYFVDYGGSTVTRYRPSQVVITLTLDPFQPSPDPMLFWSSQKPTSSDAYSNTRVYVFTNPDTYNPIYFRIIHLNSYNSYWGYITLTANIQYTETNSIEYNYTQIQCDSRYFGIPVDYPLVAYCDKPTPNLNYDYEIDFQENPSDCQWPSPGFMQSLTKIEEDKFFVYFIAESVCARIIPRHITDGSLTVSPYAFVGDNNVNIEVRWVGDLLYRDFYIQTLPCKVPPHSGYYYW